MKLSDLEIELLLLVDGELEAILNDGIL